MAKVSISEAVGLTGVSESTLRRDIKSGKVSAVGIRPHHGVKDEMEAVASYIVKPGAFEVFLHRDFCPDNGMRVKTRQKSRVDQLKMRSFRL